MAMLAVELPFSRRRHPYVAGAMIPEHGDGSGCWAFQARYGMIEYGG
jgi:hypothetical protein